ncbi:MAG: S8 family serine peptidase, partial [Acidimicrobiales bacterium]|nr:S8 family serine peptidase [Acidimicrobiales bacterium]
MRRVGQFLILGALALPVVVATAPASAAPAPPTDGIFDDGVASPPDVPGIRADSAESTADVVAPHLTVPPTAQGASLAARTDRGPVSEVMPSQPLITAGYRGQGIKVGIIDFFDPAVLATQITQGELPSVPTSNRRCFSGTTTCPFGSPGERHGNAVAEVIAEGAPDAELYLAEVGGLEGYYAAIDWFAQNGVKILNHSLIGVFDGPGDGTGPRAAIVDHAVTKGMAWFNSAGDAAPMFPGKYQGGHWRGAWSDPTGNRWLNFSGSDETLGTYCGALLGLRWSDWGAARTDYELWIGDLNISSGYHSTAVLASDYNQTAGVAPIEANDFRWLCNTDPAQGPVYDKNKDGFIHLKVKRSTRSAAASAVGDVLEIQVINGWFEYNTAYGSAALAFGDSRNPGAASVGFGTQYSARGPTNDGRIKPDFVAPECVPTSVYGGCVGDTAYRATDISAAVASGTAAAVLSAYGAMEPWQLIQYFKNYGPHSPPQYPQPVGSYAALPDNQFGHGSVRAAAPATLNANPAYFTPRGDRLLDTRKASSIRNTTAPLPPNSAVIMRVPNPMGLGSGLSDGWRTVVLNVTLVNSTGFGYVQVGPAGQIIPGASSTLNAERAGQTLANVAIVTVGPDDDIVLFTRGGGHLVVDRIGDFGGHQGFVPLEPYRAYDSHCGTCGALVGGTSRDIQITGTGPAGAVHEGVPSGGYPVSVVVSVTADTPAAYGFISAVATNINPPMPTSTANFQAGGTVTGLSVVPMSDLGRLRIYSSVATHFQVDVLGFFDLQALGGGFRTLTPTRVHDTRQPPPQPVPAAGAVLDVDTTPAGVPATASAVFANLTTVGPLGPGVVRIGADEAAVAPTFSNLSIARANQTVAAAVTSRLDSGHVSVVASPAAHTILDIAGWFEPTSNPKDGAITAAPFDSAHVPNTAFETAISANGRYVVFSQRSDGWVNTLQWWDRTTGEVEPINAGHAALPLPNSATPVEISGDGQRVLFKTVSPDLFEGDGVDLDYFIYDRASGSLDQTALLPDGTRLGERQLWFDSEITRV